jgi:peptide deformylase
MSVRQIVTIPHEVLSREAEEVKNIDDLIVTLASDMADTMYRAPGIGLAANQVAEPVRLIVVDIQYAYAEPSEKKKQPIIIINPVITTGEGEAVGQEGCLSVPEFEIDVPRFEHVQVEGVDIDGNPLKIEAEGLLARVFQHEIDHLEGRTLLDHASGLKRNLYRRKLKKKARMDS